MEDQDQQSIEQLFATETLANVSHELRSPLASIKGYTTILLRNDQRISAQERQEFLTAINEASDRLIELIDQFLELAQLEDCVIPLTPVPVQPGKLVQQAIAEVQQNSQHILMRQRPVSSPLTANHTFTCELEQGSGLAAEEDVLILGDCMLLLKLFSHLLINASLYSPVGSIIYVVIRSSLLTGDMHKLWAQLHPALQKEHPVPDNVTGQGLAGFEICVRDQGIGIPEEHLTRIFDRFHRVDTRLMREVNGLGIGLTICKRIVELHGGMIWAESPGEQGSTFHVWLPAYTVDKG